MLQGKREDSGGKTESGSIAAARGASRDTSDSFAVGIGGSSSNGRILICISLSCHQSSSNRILRKKSDDKGRLTAGRYMELVVGGISFSLDGGGRILER